MKKRLLVRFLTTFALSALLIFLLPIACKQDKVKSPPGTGVLKDVSGVKVWWEHLKLNQQSNISGAVSRIPDNASILEYWHGQFQNGFPKWNEARVYELNSETIYQIPFKFPDNLVLMNEKPDANPQLYLTGKEGSENSLKPSQTYLVVKQRPGLPNAAEIMCVIFDNSYIEVLDSAGVSYPSIAISNVYPNTNNVGDFCGSVKLYDLNGTQILEQSYRNGALNDYIEYGVSNFSIRPHPAIPTTRTYSICKWTYVYQQNCGPDAGCTDWTLIGIIFNGCETITLPDSPPISFGGGNDGTYSPGGGGTAYPPSPVITNISIKPGARLCGNYKWKTVGDAVYCQIRNLGATIVPDNPRPQDIPQTFTLGLTCVYFPKWYVSLMGWDVTEFINRAYNKAAERIQDEMDKGALPLPPTIAIYQPRFEEYMEFYLKNHPDGSYHANARIVFSTGCEGPIPVSEPKWCYPVR